MLAENWIHQMVNPEYEEGQTCFNFFFALALDLNFCSFIWVGKRLARGTNYNVQKVSNDEQKQGSYVFKKKKSGINA